MKWENLRQSNNVTADCLGKETDSDHPAEFSAAIKCMEEVDAMRVHHLQSSSKEAGHLAIPRMHSDFPGSASTDTVFDSLLSAYLEVKKIQKIGAIAGHRSIPHDSYEEREQEFQQVLDSYH